jgi:hypothetical protein
MISAGLTLLIVLTEALLFGLACAGYMRARSRRIQKSFEDLIDTLNERAATQTTLIDELTHQSRTLETKLTNTQKHIASVLGQRDFWVEWYHRQAAEHGAAQHYLMGEIELHVKRGSKHPLSPLIKEIVTDFQDVHPTLADQGRPAQPEQGQKPLADR